MHILVSVGAGLLDVLATGSSSLTCSRMACQRSEERATSQSGWSGGGCHACVEIVQRSIKARAMLLVASSEGQAEVKVRLLCIRSNFALVTARTDQNAQINTEMSSWLFRLSMA